MYPNIKKLTDNKINEKHTISSFLDFFRIYIAGTVNIEMQIKLKE
jgi:hypothetical protein